MRTGGSEFVYCSYLFLMNDDFVTKQVFRKNYRQGVFDGPKLMSEILVKSEIPQVMFRLWTRNGNKLIDNWVNFIYQAMKHLVMVSKRALRKVNRRHVRKIEVEIQNKRSKMQMIAFPAAAFEMKLKLRTSDSRKNSQMSHFSN